MTDRIFRGYWPSLLLFLLAFSPGLVAKGQGGESPYARFQQQLAAAHQGDALAQYRVSWFYSQGEGVKVDHFKSLEWLEKAAAQGLAVAQFDLGHAWLAGYAGIRSDVSRGLEWLSRAAEQGHLRAQMALARVYRLGLAGVVRDVARSNQWLKMAADQGDARAQQLYGARLVQGDAEGQVEEGLGWLQRAAEQGDHESLFLLGAMHFKGRGIPLDFVKARAYIQLSSLLIERNLKTHAELELVRERRETVAFLSRNMSDLQVDASRDLAREWLQSHPEIGIDEARLF